MTVSNLDVLVQQGEGATLAFRESLSSSFAHELVAMANTTGGKILLGVRDDGAVTGVTDSHAVSVRIQEIARDCDPPVKALVESLDGVVAVHVRESDSKPVQCSDGFFQRTGAETRKLSRDELTGFFRTDGEARFDLSPCPRFSYPEDFDREKFDAWFGRSNIADPSSVEDVLVEIGAATRARSQLLFRNVGVLFFAKNVQRFVSEARISCLVAKGDDKSHIIDRKNFAGGILADIENAMHFIKRNTPTSYRIEGLVREDVPEYPPRALREAITNAVVHRDWFFTGANISVELYTDRIDVISPGALPKGLTLAYLGDKSIRRNPLIADLLHRIDFIKNAGSGIQRMRYEAKGRNCPEPEIDVGRFVTVTFRPNPDIRVVRRYCHNPPSD